MEVQIESGWKNVLKDEFEKPYFGQLTSFLKLEKAAGKIIYPPGSLIFNAFTQTPFDNVKVVILGQDPYHNPGQAQGLSFSVPEKTPLPPSLINIFKELKTDIGIECSPSGDLSKWAKQGVLLLNSSLTVRQNEPGSHARAGWTIFTDEVIKKISDQRSGVVFLLWGKYAHEKQHLINETKHFVLKAAHPSPLSANKGFFGCKHFSKTNEILMGENKIPIDWKIN